MGVNVVRLHAADVPPGDSGWSANPEYPLIDYDSGNTRSLNPAGLERFDYWVYCLKEQGIYLHVDLLVGRAFLAGDDLDYPYPLYAVKYKLSAYRCGRYLLTCRWGRNGKQRIFQSSGAADG